MNETDTGGATMRRDPSGAGASTERTPAMAGGMASASRAVRNHERREHKAKKRYYREKHGEAKEAFSRIGGEPVETEADAIELLARKLKSGTYKEVAQLIFASAHLCWACDEMGEDETLREDASEPGGDERE